MSRPFSLAKAKNGNGRQPHRAPERPPEDETELLAGPMTILPDRYASRPPRPFLQIGIRIALWGAVALGCLGGIAGLLRPPAEAAAPAVIAPDGQAGVPAPVASVAELVVREWLTATRDTEERLAGLFVETPELDLIDARGLDVGRVTTIAGRRLQEGYWAVTVEADVAESVPVVDESDPGAGEDSAPAEGESEVRRTTTWILEVPIVGDVERGLLALTTPAVLPRPPEPATGWRPSASEPQAPAADDPTAKAVEGFFDALLAGDGDPSRYVAPRVAVEAADPPPFADTEVVDLAVDELSEGEYRVLARIRAITPGGSRQLFSYELVVVERVDRLEITHYAGAPTMVAGSAQPPEAGDEGNAGREGEGGDPPAGEAPSGEGPPTGPGSDTGAPAATTPTTPTTEPPAPEGPASADPSREGG